MTATVRGIKAEGREGSRNVDGNEYQVTYIVQVDERADGPRNAMLAFGIPDIGQFYASGNDIETGAIVTGKTCTQVSPWVYEVTVTYSTDIGDVDVSQIKQSIDNPLLEPPEVTYGFQERRILIPGRYNDPLGPPSDKAWQAGIYAPNGELFDTQPEVDISEPVLTVKRNVKTISGPDLMGLANCVNSDYWQNAEPRQLKLRAPQASRKFHNVVGFYWEVSYAIAFRWETWDVQTLNQGRYYFAGGKPTSVWSTTSRRLVKTDDVGNPIVVNLTTNGDINTTATPTFTRLRVFRELPFSSLGLI
jgi:hypothetical protein